MRTLDFRVTFAHAEICNGIKLGDAGERRDGFLAAAEAIFSEELAGVVTFDRDAARDQS